MTDDAKSIDLKTRTGDPGVAWPTRISPWHDVRLCVQSQAAVIGVLLRFFRFGILAFEVSKCYV